MFDFYSESGPDNKVDMADFWVFARRATASGGCTFGRKYAQAQKEISSAYTGVIAYIENSQVTLCDEGVADPKGKSSNAFISVIKKVGPITDNWKWAQTGYLRWQNPNSVTVSRKVFAEVRWKPGLTGKSTVASVFTPTGTHQYQCEMLSASNGTWYFDVVILGVRIQWHTETKFEWQNTTGNVVTWGAEISHKENVMVGTNADHCDISLCEYHVVAASVPWTE